MRRTQLSPSQSRAMIALYFLPGWVTKTGLRRWYRVSGPLWFTLVLPTCWHRTTAPHPIRPWRISKARSIDYAEYTGDYHHRPLGTHLTGDTSQTVWEETGDVSVKRFPLGVPQPIGAASFSGQVALSRYLTTTGCKVYTPDHAALDGIAFAHVENGRIKEFTGPTKRSNRSNSTISLSQSCSALIPTLFIPGMLACTLGAPIYPLQRRTRTVGRTACSHIPNLFTFTPVALMRRVKLLDG